MTPVKGLLDPEGFATHRLRTTGLGGEAGAGKVYLRGVLATAVCQSLRRCPISLLAKLAAQQKVNFQPSAQVSGTSACLPTELRAIKLLLSPLQKRKQKKSAAIILCNEIEPKYHP